MNAKEFVFTYPEDFEQFKFPDGQLHVKLKDDKLPEIIKFDSAIIRARVRNPDELFGLCLAYNIIANHGFAKDSMHLELYYLTGGRMDRVTSEYEPFTLQMVTHIINSLQFETIHVFCPHSSATTNLLNNGWAGELEDKELNFYRTALSITYYRNNETNVPAIFLPNVEGQKRFYNKLHKHLNKWEYSDIVAGNKKRDMATGKLSAFEVLTNTVPECIMILDDLVEKGGTFIGQAKILRERGAKFITLAVPHAILSGGYDLEGIDLIVTTNSYRDFKDAPSHIVCLNVEDL
jgi:ribose-phosphate pyrophosphokinase